MKQQVIVTGDDFGLAPPVNEAIIEAYCRGVLTTASLMVGAKYSEDAIERAKQHPLLRVGLHLVLVEGHPVLAPRDIPDLVNSDGDLLTNFTQAGFRFFLRPGIRKQLEAEIRAQFELFHKTGLAMDHVNAHNHIHLHPTVLRLVLKIGKEYGLRAVRLPNEPPLRSWKASRRSLRQKLSSWAFLSPWISLMKCLLRQAHIRFNNFIFGMADSGAMTTELVLGFLRNLPKGVTELYFHPATARCPEIDYTMQNYRHEEEFQTLTSESLLQAFRSAGIQRISFSDL